MKTAHSTGASEQVFQRVAIVDELIRKKGWNLGVANELALTMGVDRSTVYRLRNMADSWTRRHIRPTNIEAFRLQQVVALGDIANEAREAKDYSAAVRALDTQAKIIGTISPTKVEVSGGYSVTHQAAIARVSALGVDELRGIAQREVIEVAAVESATDEPSR